VEATKRPEAGQADADQAQPLQGTELADDLDVLLLTDDGELPQRFESAERPQRDAPLPGSAYPERSEIGP
jgi:hypothetical protein